MATALFGAPPSSSFEEALAHLSRAEALSTGAGGKGAWIANRLKLAQTLIGACAGASASSARWLRPAHVAPFARTPALPLPAALGRADEARAWLIRATELRPGPAEDAETLEQLRQLCKAQGVN